MVNTHEKNGYLTQFVQIIEAEGIFLTEVHRFGLLSLLYCNMSVKKRHWQGRYNWGADTNRHQMQAVFFQSDAPSSRPYAALFFTQICNNRKRACTNNCFFIQYRLTDVDDSSC